MTVFLERPCFATTYKNHEKIRSRSIACKCCFGLLEFRAGPVLSKRAIYGWRHLSLIERDICAAPFTDTQLYLLQTTCNLNIK